MNDAQLHNLPVAVREAFRNIPDSAFDDYPKVVEIRSQIDRLESEHSACASRCAVVTARHLALLAMREKTLEEISHSFEGRPAALAEMLLAGEDLENDKRVLAEISTKQYLADAIDTATPEILRTIARMNAETGSVARLLEPLDDALRDVLDGLKLQQARSNY